MQSAEFDYHPSLAVSEEFTDNVYETNSRRLHDFITRVQPGVALGYKAPAVTGSLDYVLDYRHYARNTRNDDLAHALSAKASLNTLDKRFFFDVSEEFQRVSLDVTRDVARESLFVNQSDRNIVTASPYAIFNPTERFKVKTGSKFVDTRYFDSLGVDKNDHIGFLNMTYELTKQWSLTAGYTYTREISDLDRYNQHVALGGFRYEYADKSFLYAQAGNSWTDYDSGQRLDSIVWDAGITHSFDTITASLTTGVRYNEDPLRDILQETYVSGSIEKRFARGSIAVIPGYSEYVLTKTDTLQTTKYGGTIRGKYELTSKMNGMLAFTGENYEQKLLRSHTTRYQADTGLSYLLTKQLSLLLSYVYTSYNSPGIPADNFHVNRGMVELKMTF